MAKILRTALATGLLIGAIVVTAVLTSPHGSGAANLQAGPPSWLPSMVEKEASVRGDRAPSSVHWVLTTRSLAVGLTDDQVDSNQPVYMVVLTGKFVDRFMSVPPGHPLAHGPVAVLLFDASTRQLLDYGETASPPDIAKLGRLQTMPLPSVP
jgi:hypothetical protein